MATRIVDIRFAAICLAAAVTIVVSVAPALATASTRGGNERGPYAVGKRSYTFIDRSRSTASNGAYPGASTRTLPTLLLYPAHGDPGEPPAEGAAPIRRKRTGGFPLIVFSHGLGTTGPLYDYLLARFDGGRRSAITPINPAM